MGFLFGLFRFLTWGNIVVAGFFILFMLMSLLLSPSPLSMLLSLVLLGAVLYHNILCTQLQRTIASPGTPFPESLPRTILVSGIIAFMYAILVAVNLIFISRISDSELMKMMNTSALKETDGVSAEAILRLGRRMAIILGGIHAAAIAVNCELSRIFFNRWRKDQEEKEEDTNSFFDINNP